MRTNNFKLTLGYLLDNEIIDIDEIISLFHNGIDHWTTSENLSIYDNNKKKHIKTKKEYNSIEFILKNKDKEVIGICSGLDGGLGISLNEIYKIEEVE